MRARRNSVRQTMMPKTARTKRPTLLAEYRELPSALDLHHPPSQRSTPLGGGNSNTCLDMEFDTTDGMDVDIDTTNGVDIDGATYGKLYVRASLSSMHHAGNLCPARRIVAKWRRQFILRHLWASD